MALERGTKLGPYTIESPLGAGGMGEVYKATDTRLERTVAIKVLPAHVASDPDLKQRFEREAKTISSLNHPHICTVHDVGKEGDIDFLVMEYLEGETLADRLQKGALPLDQALKYAIEIADALDKAHRQGVTHRDLKPANIMLTKTGAKLLDFGLAKLKPRHDASGAMDRGFTAPRALTGPGMILGTLPYMAPEQLEGIGVDARTDIFAFGVVLYEMVTSKAPFEGNSQASVVHAIMGVDPPPLSRLEPATPTALDYVVSVCLSKDPDDRWQTARDLFRELKRIEASGAAPARSAPATPGPQSAVWQRPLPALLTVVAVAALTGLTVWSLRPTVVNTPRVGRFTLTAPGNEPIILSNIHPDVALSPDGTKVVYLAGPSMEQSALTVRAVDQLVGVPLDATAGSLTFNPFISPDNAWVGFLANSTLQRVSILGGPAVKICDSGSLRLYGGSWSESQAHF